MNKTRVIRASWLAIFLGQLILYYLSFPHLLAIVRHNHMLGNLSISVLALDALGAMSWGMLLLFLEEGTFRVSKWFYFTGISAFALLTFCVVVMNFGAWR